MPETGIVRPDPDPTVRTNEAIIASVSSLEAVMQERFVAYDKAIVLLQTKADKEPQISQVADSVAFLKELFQTQLKERDIRSEQTKKDGDVAIAAALQAQKEAVGKTEYGLTKELDAVKLNTATEMNGLRGQINDLKDRQNNNDGRKKGASDSWGYIVVAAGLVLNAAALWLKH
jgi:hypothetical protein